MRKWTKVRFYIFLAVQEHKSFWISILASWPISASHYLFPVPVHPRRKTDLPLLSGYMSDAALMANAPSKYNKYYVAGSKILNANAVFSIDCFSLCLSFALLSFLSCSFSVRFPLFCVMMHIIIQTSHCNVIFRHFQGPLCGSVN